MKCAICGIEIDSIDQAREEAWIPYAWDGDREQEGPFCGSCSETLMQVDGNNQKYSCQSGQNYEFCKDQMIQQKLIH